MDNRSTDGADILFWNAMVGQINKVLCYYNQVGAVPNLKLLKSYCCCLWVWDLFHDAISDICKA